MRAKEVDRKMSSGHFVRMYNSCKLMHKRANGCTFMKTEQGTKGKTPQNEKPPGQNTLHVGAAAINNGAIRLIRRPDQPCINAPRQTRLRKELL